MYHQLTNGEVLKSIAQEVEATAKKMNYDFSGVDAPKNGKDFYALRYAEFVVPLVKAVQELSNTNDSLKAENASLEARLEKIEALLKINPSGAVSVSDASLDQNSPNPFKGSTLIGYNLPQRFTTAKLAVYDAAGKTLKLVNITNPGRGNVRLDATTLASGEYSYALMVDGKLVDTKKMVLAK